jgi:hypothetical protein
MTDPSRPSYERRLLACLLFAGQNGLATLLTYRPALSLVQRGFACWLGKVSNKASKLAITEAGAEFLRPKATRRRLSH